MHFFKVSESPVIWFSGRIQIAPGVKTAMKTCHSLDLLPVRARRSLPLFHSLHVYRKSPAGFQHVGQHRTCYSHSLVHARKSLIPGGHTGHGYDPTLPDPRYMRCHRNTTSGHQQFHYLLEGWSIAGELAPPSPALGQSQDGEADLQSPNTPAKTRVTAWLSDHRGRRHS